MVPIFLTAQNFMVQMSESFPWISHPKKEPIPNRFPISSGLSGKMPKTTDVLHTNQISHRDVSCIPRSSMIFSNIYSFQPFTWMILRCSATTIRASNQTLPSGSLSVSPWKGFRLHADNVRSETRYGCGCG